MCCHSVLNIVPSVLLLTAKDEDVHTNIIVLFTKAPGFEIWSRATRIA